MTTVVPAYGRDYTSAKLAKEAFLSGRDFIISDVSSKWNGMYCSCRDFSGEQVKVRYKNNTRAIIVQVPK